MTPTPKEILRERTKTIAEVVKVLNQLPEDQPVTIQPEMVKHLKQLFRHSI